MDKSQVLEIVRHKFIERISTIEDQTKAYLETYDELADASPADVCDALGKVRDEVISLMTHEQ